MAKKKYEKGQTWPVGAFRSGLMLTYSDKELREGYMSHIDGHFLWKDRSNHNQYGWKKYSNNFVNFVIPLEKTDKSNGCLYIARKSDTEKICKNFKKIIKNLDPNKYTLTKKLIKKIKFYPIELNQGDLCIFNFIQKKIIQKIRE